ncbi:hypothetical protein N7457_003143 [Penicillium paradoxum]|uniref:uncharacterized protein n=1 Tax=Penicillium paradoxum TaxID=176176 RepID=UPI0025474983|nr:uncharacterized protein N7457_003143 [Penicillium paradoxum]KAJ5788153.1 hypothetical protein N7457_003143 [Penicillium paradoxum]
MPKKSPDLTIELAAPPFWTCASGDKVIGNIVHRSSIVAPDATLTLSLNGHVKIGVGDKRENHRSKHQEKRLLLAPTRRIIFRGPLHLAKEDIDYQNECLSWPFEVRFPTKPWTSPLATFRGPRYKTLPGSFSTGENTGNDESFGLVEYYLEARLEYNRGGTFVQFIATAETKLRHPAPELPILGYALKQETAKQIIRSHGLFPDRGLSALTLRQRTQQARGSSKVPQFGFLIQLEVPTVVQLDDPSPFPLNISVAPDWKLTSEDIKSVPQIVQLNYVKMTLLCNSQIKTGRTKYRGVNNKCYNSRLEHVFGSLEHPVFMMAEEGSECLDIGQMFQLALRWDGFVAAGKLLSGMRIEPDFVTYNLSFAHSVEYEVSMTVAEEVRIVKFFDVKLKIVGCMNPPAIDRRGL